MVDLGRPWSENCLVALDTETTGQYPLGAEICEIAGVKWQNGEIIGEYQTLVRPPELMSEAVIKIHNITNEMVQSAPRISQVIGAFKEFCGDAVLVAHHAPFDLGFLAIEFERAGLSCPGGPNLCSSLLSRILIPDSPNHRLQTLVEHLRFNGGQAHRALDDARACLQVILACLKKLGDSKSLYEILEIQESSLQWPAFAISPFRGHPIFGNLLTALEKKQLVQIVYEGGSRKGQARTVAPLGLVRNPQGDYLVALEEGETLPKRYFLKRISASAL